ncbi:hypothetical protein [Jiella marina]|uniref:hypothetical protein n=1 Tax=Jiella sp. LLJ827 TaxID=2917712 RepID=UPI002100A361|nr:hypothetical protein [Jiella sp. LLJ827]MCQ0987754.1 hypothetical protein [Jiella sp. LLJ827]
MLKKVVFCISLTGFIISPASGRIIPFNKSTFVQSSLNYFKDLSRNHGLSDAEATAAVNIAGAWFWAMPCEGDISKIPKDLQRTGNLYQYSSRADPNLYVPQLIAFHLFTQDPRLRYDYVCPFALDMANLYALQ